MTSIGKATPHWLPASILTLALLASSMGQAQADTAKEHKHIVTPQSSNRDIDSAGLPAEQLAWLVQTRDVKRARMLLARTPRHPNDQDARTLWSAACFAAEKNYEEAIAEFHKVKNLSAAKGHILFLAASTYALAQEYSRARELCTLAINRDNCTECYDVRAACYTAEKRYEEASADYEKEAKCGKRYARDFYCKAAQAMLDAKQPAKGLALIQKSPPLDNGQPNVPSILTTATCLEKLNRWQDAVTVLNKAIPTANAKVTSEVQFWQAACIKERAKCYEKMGKKIEAAADKKTLENLSSGLKSDLLGK